jgi:hypothetical protein
MILSILGIVFLLSSAVSATGTVSPDGKTIDIKYSFIKSHYINNAYVFKKTGIYGTGYYTQILVSGKNNVGIKVNTTLNYFNKYGPSVLFNDFKSARITTGNYSDGAVGSEKLVSNYLITDAGKGTINGVHVMSSTGSFNLCYVDGQKLIKNSLETIKIFDNNTFYGKMITKTQFFYKKFGNYYDLIKETKTSSTYFANGDNRTSVITTKYNRTSDSKLVGKKTSGKSSGTDKINNTIVNYTGDISIGTQYDPNDFLNEKYTYGNYHESLKSSAKNLNKDLPIESIYYSP